MASMPLVAVLRGVAPQEAPAIAAALHDEGFMCVEVTLNSPEPLASIAAIRERYDGRMLVGAGTVTTVDEVEKIAVAGAQLVVSPDTNARVIRAVKTAGLASLPGFFTPSEALAALAAGADALKLFPAEATTPRVLTSLLGVLPTTTRILPVGGIDATNIPSWRAAGAAGFGVGGGLYRPGSTASEVAKRARALVGAWSASD